MWVEGLGSLFGGLDVDVLARLLIEDVQVLKSRQLETHTFNIIHCVKNHKEMLLCYSSV